MTRLMFQFSVEYNPSLLISLTGDDYINTIDTEEFRKFNARYKFVISYENSVCNDYITEKIWRPLTLGVVPIYFGAPNIQVLSNDSALERRNQ